MALVRFVADCQLRVHIRIDMISRVAELATYKGAVADDRFGYELPLWPCRTWCSIGIILLIPVLDNSGIPDFYDI